MENIALSVYGTALSHVTTPVLVSIPPLVSGIPKSPGGSQQWPVDWPSFGATSIKRSSARPHQDDLRLSDSHQNSVGGNSKWTQEDRCRSLGKATTHCATKTPEIEG
ncbi:hypothetical protein PoB_005487000 [Plakobranchus ocellatus]|uniref:Uncharacterized protein n=1 Tax=Plakobranchus ocellatus TaxID=259542 RepID=A0AAV4CAC1_9GAST|nr:hypothetical protein PoB_005487000 [Plakobranchus ocellatus]